MGWTTTRKRGRRCSGLPCALFGVLVVLLALAGCASGNGATGAHATPTASPTTPAAPVATATPGLPAVQITDLGEFRQRLSAAVTSGSWDRVAPLLSPAFSFQGESTGGGKLVMPGAATEFAAFYTGNAPWAPQDQGSIGVYRCFSGTTPPQQLIAFKGGNGWMALIGIERWQGYWVVAWAFQNLQGGPGTCAG